MRVCYACGMTITSCWYLNHDESNNVICARCYQQIIYRPNHKHQTQLYNNKRNPINAQMRLNYKGKRLFLGINPRTGICTICKKSIHKGEIKRTNLHHLKYDDYNPLNNTIELCPSCHKIEHNGSIISTTKYAIYRRKWELKRKRGNV